MKRLCLFALWAILSFTAAATDLVEFFDQGKPAGSWAPAASLKFTDSETGAFDSALALVGGSNVVGRFAPIDPAKEDLECAFDLMRQDNEGAVTVILTGSAAGSKRLFGLIIGAGQGAVLLSGPDGNYTYMRMTMAENKRFRFSCSYAAATKTATIRIDGQKIADLPVEEASIVDMLILSPKTGHALADDIEIHSYPPSIKGHKSVLGGVKAKIELEGQPSREEILLTDGNLEQPANVPMGATVTFWLPERAETYGMQIYGGAPDAAKNPSGDASPRGLVVHGFCNGTWLPLAEVKEADSVKAADVARNFLRLDFKPMLVDAVRLTMTDTNDTGKRLSAPDVVLDKKDRVVALREVAFFSTATQEEADEKPSLQAEYRLPVYQDQKEAALTVVVPEGLKAASATVAITSADGKECFKRAYPLKAGRQDLFVPLEGIPDGRNMTVIDAGEAGGLKRLLRIERSVAEPLPSEPLAMAGRKLFFLPDGQEIAAYSNTTPEVFPATPHAIYTSERGKPLFVTGTMRRAANGEYAVTIMARPLRSLLRGAAQTVLLTSSSLKGPWKVVDKLPQGTMPALSFPADSPRLLPMPPAGSKFRFYDPEKDGQIPLNRMGLYFNGYMNDAERDYGCVVAPPRCRWPAATTEAGENLLMTREPVIYDKPYYAEDEFDDGYRTNDNGFGAWLSRDGQKLYYVNGQTLKRSAPYAIAYDNLPNCFRILSIWETSDGRDWKFSRYLAPPDENDSEGAQHYGGGRLVVRDGAFTLAYIIAYDSLTQQNYLELAYTRDGLHFHRFPGHKPFVRTNDPTSWHFGYMNPPQTVHYQDGNSIFSFINYISATPHFMAEVCTLYDDCKQVTAADVRRRFTGRGFVERWPFFKQVGGWEGVAEMARNRRESVGLIESRMDGWFGVAAGDGVAEVVTRRLSASGTALKLNATIEKGGFVEAQIKGADGNIIATKRLEEGDALDLSLFDKLPDGEFTITLRFSRARLYTLYFGK